MVVSPKGETKVRSDDPPCGIIYRGLYRRAAAEYQFCSDDQIECLTKETNNLTFKHYQYVKLEDPDRSYLLGPFRILVEVPVPALAREGRASVRALPAIFGLALSRAGISRDA